MTDKFGKYKKENTMNLFLLILAVFFGAFSFAHARPESPATFNTYDGLAPGGRAIAMGQAFCAIGQDPATIYYNPAGLTTVEKQYFSSSFEVTRQSTLSAEQIFSSEMLRDTNLIFLGLISQSGAFSWRPLSDATIKTIDGANWQTTEIKVNSYTLSANHKEKDDKVSSGLNISYINGRIAQSGVKDNVPFANLADGNGFSIDFGTMYKISPEFRAGINLQNLAGFIWWDDYETDQLPFTLRTGFAFEIENFLTFASDWVKKYYRRSAGPEESIHFGLEQNLGNILKVRGGIYGKDLKSDDTTHISAGVGYNKNNYSLSLSGEKYKLEGTDVFRYLFSLDLPI